MGLFAVSLESPAVFVCAGALSLPAHKSQYLFAVVLTGWATDSGSYRERSKIARRLVDSRRICRRERIRLGECETIVGLAHMGTEVWSYDCHQLSL
jgi:hypothetical protein